MGLAPQRQPTLDIWAVSDGRAGIENQALGLAGAVAALRPARIIVKRLQWRSWLRRLPTRLAPARLVLDPRSDILDSPWPDLWIGAGRASVPAGIAVRRWSQGRSFVVQLQDPRRAACLFDLVVPPSHDGLEGANVFPILGASHRVTPEVVAEAAAGFADRLNDLARPVTAVLVGGRSRAFDLGAERAGTLGRELREAVSRSGGSLVVSFSRRTPEPARTALSAALASTPGWIWDGEGANPYLAFLGIADIVVATEDSVTMIAEAVSAGRPVLIARVEGRQARKDRFHAALGARDLARPFAGNLATWPIAPLRETERAAAEVLRRLDARRRIA